MSGSGPPAAPGCITRVATSLEELRGDDPAAQAEAVAHHCRAGHWEMEEMAPSQARESFARAHSIAAAS